MLHGQVRDRSLFGAQHGRAGHFVLAVTARTESCES